MLSFLSISSNYFFRFATIFLQLFLVSFCNIVVRLPLYFRVQQT
jgi:hypothetical protein